MKSTTKTMDSFFLALPILYFLGAFFLLQRIIYVYLNGLISEMLFFIDYDYSVNCNYNLYFCL